MAGTKEVPPFRREKVAVNFAIVIAAFPIIFLGELPDKAMFASLVLSTRGKPLFVWCGAAGAIVVHVTIAVTIRGILFHLVPHRVLDGIVALMLLVGAGLAIREARKAEEEETLVEREAKSGRSVVTTAFVVIFLAEWAISPRSSPPTWRRTTTRRSR